MTSALRRLPSSPQTTRVAVTSLYSKLKLEDLYDFDNEVKQKLLDRLYPAKSVDRNIFNHFLNQTFIVNGILSDKYKSLHHTHQLRLPTGDYIKRIQDRYEAKHSIQSKIQGHHVVYENEVELHRHNRKEGSRFLKKDEDGPRRKKLSCQSSFSVHKVYPTNLDD